jgi:branched-chain amino acid transport system substrate-binding protein
MVLEDAVAFILPRFAGEVDDERASARQTEGVTRRARLTPSVRHPPQQVRGRRPPPPLMRGRINAFALLAFATLFITPAHATPGVTPTEVVVGTHVDLSGPLSPVGAAVRNGLLMGFDEANARGGPWGRKLTLVVADNGYDADKAIAAEKTILSPDRIFAILCPTGTPPVAAAMPLFVNAGVLHLFPFTAADDTYVPQQPLEFAIDLPVADQTRTGLRALFALRGAMRVGVLYRDDAFGRAALDGIATELQRRQMHAPLAESFAPGATSVTRQLAALKDGGAEIVVVGGVAQEAFTAMREAHARRWSPIFLCPTACYVPQVPTLGGRAVAGLYAVATTPIPYPDDPDPALRAWVKRYETRFHTLASTDAFRAYLDARLFAEVLRRTGPDLRRSRFASALEAMPPWRDPVYGGVPVDFTTRDHLGFHGGFLAQVKGGRWMTSPSTLHKR